MFKRIALMALVAVAGILLTNTFGDDPPNGTADERIISLEHKLDIALQRIDELEARVKALESAATGAKTGPSKAKASVPKPDVLADLIDADWTGSTKGSDDGKPWGPFPATAKLVSRDGDTFVLRVTVTGTKGILVYEYRCEAKGSAYVIAKCDRIQGDTGAGEGLGPVVISQSNVTVDAKTITLSYQRMKANKNQQAIISLRRN